jgi:hypothetical protein
MAIENRKPAETSGGATGGATGRDGRPAEMSQKRRWLVFGSNVAVAVLLATILAVAAVWLSGTILKGRARSDLTSSGRFSLSPRTKALLADLPYDVTITNLYRHSPESPASEEYWQRIQDLLSEYAAANPARVSVEAIDPDTDLGSVEKLVARLRDRYAGELEKPKALAEDFLALQKELGEFLGAEAKHLAVAADKWKDAPPDGPNNLRMVAQKWAQMEMVGELTAGDVQALGEQALPAYSTAVSRARDYLKQVGDLFAALPDLYAQVEIIAKAAPPPPEVKAVLSGAAAYAPWRKRIEAFNAQAAGIKQLELDTLRRDISQGEVLLIETPDRVKAVSFDDVWTRNASATEETPEAETRLFAGESAVSSALLGLVNPEKPAVLFVTFGAPAAGAGGQFSELADRVRKANFIVEDWDLARNHEMPRPEHMTKAILVFAPPPTTNPQRPIPPPTADLYAPAIEAVRSGTPAIVMGEPGGMMGPTIPYADLYMLFGVTPTFSAIAVHKIPVDLAGTEQAILQIEIAHYPDTPITQTLGGLPSLFVAACPLEISKKLPEGVTAEPIVELPGGPDYWGDTNVFAATRRQAKRDEGEDVPGPFPLAVAATRQVAGGEQKAVLFGGHFAEDRVAMARDALGRDMFPGNAELFTNSLLWVAGTEHLITVSAEAIQARRIGDLGDWSLPLEILIIGGLPAIVLAAGVVVWLVRRR